MRFLPVALGLAILALAALPSATRAQTPTPSPSPQITSDIVVVTNQDSFAPGDLATITLRNDGTVPYQVPNQPVCSLDYRDAATNREVIVESHCDLPGFSADPLEPGETAVFLSAWALVECVEPGFFCSLLRPLPTGQYTVSGALPSVDGTRRAEFSKTISITGPEFTNDVKVVLGRSAADPPAAMVQLRNDGNRDYAFSFHPACEVRFYRPDGFRFDIPGPASCENADNILSPGEVFTAFATWNLDECDPSGPTFCSTTIPLQPGNYDVRVSVLSSDRRAFSEHTAVQTVPLPAQVTPSPTPTRTPGDLPRLGGDPSATGRSLNSDAMFLVLAAIILLAMVSYRAARRE